MCYLFHYADAQAIQIASGSSENTCVILFDGSVKCWGVNILGQLGYGDTISRGDDVGEMGNNLSRVYLGTGRTAKQISTGHSHLCAILDNDALKCWRNNAAGQLGIGSTATFGDGPGEMGDNLPVVDLGTWRVAIQVAAGSFHSCAVLDDATLKCWGSALKGITGSGATATIVDNAN